MRWMDASCIALFLYFVDQSLCLQFMWHCVSVYASVESDNKRPTIVRSFRDLDAEPVAQL